jgi:pyruvate,water dikinase
VVSKRWVFWLDKLGQEHKDLVGNKCANLGEMAKLGLRVPPGFALSIKAYKDFMEMTGNLQKIERVLNKSAAKELNLNQINEASFHIRQIVESKAMPEEMEEMITSCYRKLCRRCHVAKIAVSTRSAGPVSQPGQYETYLNVVGESDVIGAIKKVWSSTFNPRSLAARGKKGITLSSGPIGVAVLKMVNARSAGIIFTADPNTGDTDRMIIEANWGLGESVVAGKVIPDVYVLDKKSLEIREKKLGQKSEYVVFREAGVANEETPLDKRSNFCLSDEETREIGRMGNLLEEHFGVPQDVEWAIDQDLSFPESVILLQTRTAVIAQKRKPVDQIIDLAVSRFSRGGFGGLKKM